MNSYSVKAYKLPKIVKVGDDLFQILANTKLKEGQILAVSSKIVSLSEGSVIKKSKVKNVDDLIKVESEKYIERKFIPSNYALLTLKNNIITASAGVDEFDGNYVLWPKDPMRSCEKIWKLFKNKYHLINFGVIITDSHTVPLRRGIMGFALGFFGFKPLRSYKGRKSLFGRTMKTTQANIADALSAAAVVAMGEGGEQTPIAVISGNLDIEFISKKFLPKGKFSAFEVDIQQDIYSPLLQNVKWKKGNKKSRFFKRDLRDSVD